MITFTLISILILAIPVVVLQGFFSYFEVPLSLTGFHQSELISFFFMILKDIEFWKIAVFALVVFIPYSILKSWGKFWFIIGLGIVLVPLYKLLYLTGYNTPLDTLNYEIYSGENCLYGNGFEKYIVLDSDFKNAKLIPLDIKDNSFIAGRYINRDISAVECEFSKEKSLLIKTK